MENENYSCKNLMLYALEVFSDVMNNEDNLVTTNINKICKSKGNVVDDNCVKKNNADNGNS